MRAIRTVESRPRAQVATQICFVHIETAAMFQCSSRASEMLIQFFFRSSAVEFWISRFACGRSPGLPNDR